MGDLGELAIREGGVGIALDGVNHTSSWHKLIHHLTEGLQVLASDLPRLRPAGEACSKSSLVINERMNIHFFLKTWLSVRAPPVCEDLAVFGV